MKGILITVLVYTLGLVILKGCVAVVGAQTFEGVEFPGDISGTMLDLERANAELQLEYATSEISDSLWRLEMQMADWDGYIRCLKFNEGIYEMATEAGDTGLELSPRFERHLKDCWRMVP